VERETAVKRGTVMFENMSGIVGDAMYAERLRQSVMHARCAEAGKRKMHRQARIPPQLYREATARALIAIAIRIAPSVAAQNPGAPALAL
jgi:hypothetical protein